jgi:hypothetical protein
VESKLGPLGTSATYWPIVPALGDCEDGEFGGMNGRGNRSTRRKPAPVPLCPPQIPLDQSRDWTRAAAVRSQRLTASAMARPPPYACLIIWNISLADLPLFGRTWHLPVAQTETFSISAARKQLPFTTVTFFLNTPHVRNYYLLGWDKNGHGTILWFHVSAEVHNSATMRPIHEIINCTMYIVLHTCRRQKSIKNNSLPHYHVNWVLIESETCCDIIL